MKSVEGKVPISTSATNTHVTPESSSLSPSAKDNSFSGRLNLSDGKHLSKVVTPDFIETATKGSVLISSSPMNEQIDVTTTKNSLIPSSSPVNRMKFAPWQISQIAMKARLNHIAR